MPPPKKTGDDHPLCLFFHLSLFSFKILSLSPLKNEDCLLFVAYRSSWLFPEADLFIFSDNPRLQNCPDNTCFPPFFELDPDPPPATSLRHASSNKLRSLTSIPRPSTLDLKPFYTASRRSSTSGSMSPRCRSFLRGSFCISGLPLSPVSIKLWTPSSFMMEQELIFPPVSYPVAPPLLSNAKCSGTLFCHIVSFVAM